MELAALIISIFALLLSIKTACDEAKRDYKITRITIEAEIYKKVFDNYLIKRIPEARGYLLINVNNLLQDDQLLIDELNAMRRSALVFRYAKPAFYKDLKRSLQAFEDYLVSSEGIVFVGDEKTDFLKNVQEYLTEIYDLVFNAYSGKYT